MLLVREIMHCKPGKVRAMVDRFLAMNKLMEKSGTGRMRIMTDVTGERYWTVVAESEVENLDAYLTMDSGSPEDAKEFARIMEGYHDLVDIGRREIYKLEN